ncbi:MAG TPA: D-alanyl-D-alanine carboxypeptidase family protein [bacterium]|nr:D-alanyl-D-alanine carboxypeptidase family protein [bacterium]
MIAALASALVLSSISGPAGPAVIRPVPCVAAILINAETGEVLHEQDADLSRGPASLVKMMVELIILEDVEAGRIALSDTVKASTHASTMGGSQVFLKEGEVQTVHALLQAAAIASANDAAVALAEHASGSEEKFVERMNARAKQLGCSGTKFVNVHGLDLPRQGRAVTTARDLTIIARALIRHPLALEFASTWRAPFRDGEFWLDNTNKLLRKCDGLDGLKTGWTPRAGGCFCATASRDGVRLVSVVMGAPGGLGRFNVTKQLLDDGFSAVAPPSEPAAETH